ncbi:hypothetical protein CTAYLR_008429 [Chrysophaeum taylorii]|uniref:Protein kinase domain-containing protein n=1 Tax=Chrysophaeum taylorii TaxID=2483200 RepID=A0AAD7UJG7_9STRA|nr:hypothetical protein CTAYLR_008429 [Chrysophaeum taylorii]
MFWYVVVVVGLVGGVVLLLWRRRRRLRRPKKKKLPAAAAIREEEEEVFDIETGLMLVPATPPPNLRRRGSPTFWEEGGNASSTRGVASPLMRPIPTFKSPVVVTPPPPKHHEELSRSEVTICERIGGGAFGSVYRGSFRGTEVAVKVVGTTVEAAMLSKLRHPNICLFMGSLRLDGGYGIVTEFVRRGSLWDVLREPDLEWPLWRQAKVAADIARGLAYLHAHAPPVVHRDVKSPNVLCDFGFRVKLCDVGLAKEHDDLRMTAGCGTPQWMSPECLAGRPYGPKADVYSFAVVLYEIVTRRCPYDDDDVGGGGKGAGGVALAVQVVQSGLRPDLGGAACPPDLRRLITAAWAFDPARRPDIHDAIPLLDHLAGGVSRGT